MEQVRQVIARACKDVFSVDVDIVLTRPDEQFGDYATNVALQLAKQLNKNPRQVAEELAAAIKSPDIAKTAVAGPGFINISLSDQALTAALKRQIEPVHQGKVVVIEHTDANPFKELHIGHAYSNTIGEALGRLYKVAGATVHQVSYHGDVGLHIAMAIYGLQHPGEPGDSNESAYARGVRLAKDSDEAKQAVAEINKKIYDRSDPEINELYDKGKAASFAEFEKVYQRLHVSFEKQYLESQTGPEGQKIVEQHLDDGIFEKSDGAIVFKGEKFDLHTRVFINSQGLPTYEAKEIGLIFAKDRDYHFDEAVVVTANEIDQYFQVLVAAIGQIDKQLAAKLRHVSHGVVKLPSGKMSSRTGQIITAAEVLEALEQAITAARQDQVAVEANVLGALKYEFLKHRIGGDLIFSIEDSVSLEGNSGPYLQYAHARACSILAKKAASADEITEVDDSERSLVRKLGEYAEVVDRAVRELMPHHICTYLYELAQTFNRFYEANRVIDDPREAPRLRLVKAYADILRHGLDLLNIPAPEKM